MPTDIDILLVKIMLQYTYYFITAVYVNGYFWGVIYGFADANPSVCRCELIGLHLRANKGLLNE